MILQLLLLAAVTAVLIYGLAKMAPSMKLLAHPGDHRLHQEPTPMVGGIGIYLGIWAGCMLIDQSFARLLPSLLLLCVVGILDDRYSLPSVVRFIAQGAAAYLMVSLTGVELESLGRPFTHHELILGQWSVPITIFACIGVINAINMSDGLDGLAGCLVLLVLTSLLLLGSHDQGLILVTAAAVLGFLVWNVRLLRPRAKVFMGDAGSTMLGLLIAYLLIGYSQSSIYSSSPYSPSNLGFRPVTALWFLALPLLDAVGVLLIRPLRGRSPFSADRIHYHHQLLDNGVSVNATLAIALIIQLVFILTGALFWRNGIAESVQFYSFLGIFVAYLLYLWHRTKAGV